MLPNISMGFWMRVGVMVRKGIGMTGLTYASPQYGWSSFHSSTWMVLKAFMSCFYDLIIVPAGFWSLGYLNVSLVKFCHHGDFWKMLSLIADKNVRLRYCRTHSILHKLAERGHREAEGCPPSYLLTWAFPINQPLCARKSITEFCSLKRWLQAQPLLRQWRLSSTRPVGVVGMQIAPNYPSTQGWAPGVGHGGEVLQRPVLGAKVSSAALKIRGWYFTCVLCLFLYWFQNNLQ